ncbi:MAG: carboxypeptidase-like regulatory domain-containing protein [Acidobacteriota bacterium]
MTRWLLSFWLALAFAPLLASQTTMGVIRGRVVNTADGQPVRASATIVCFNVAGTKVAEVLNDFGGHFSIPLVPPGVYWLRVETQGSQPAEVHNLVIPVAGIIEQDFQLRPLTDVFDQRIAQRFLLPGTKNVIRFYGPDLDLSRTAFLPPWETGIHIFEPSISSVIDPVPIRDLPFAGRDVYTMLLTQPAVTSDSATARSLGLSANGQRPASSNFLLDGMEFNNSLIAGPLAAIPPEAIQEYRVSINGYSAEFGRTAGFLANAVSRSGTPQWHGIGYAYLRNEALNANDFQNNLRGLSRPRSRETQFGYQAGGPLRRDRLYVSSAFERLSASGRQAERDYLVPGTGFLNFLNVLSPSNRARQLLALFPPPASQPVAGDPFAGVVRIGAPVTQRRHTSIQRIDANIGKDHRLMGRLITTRLLWPDFIWSPYPEFVSGLRQRTDAGAVSLVSSFSNHLTHELRFGVTDSDLGWDRAHPELPTLTVSGGNPGVAKPLLPGSPAAYSYHYAVRNEELDSNWMLWRGIHLMKLGGSFFMRSIGDELPFAQAGRYDFASLAALATGTQIRLFAPLDRAAEENGVFQLPNMDREYRLGQGAIFFQDSIRITSHATLNVGVRYEYFGSPRYTRAAPAPMLQFGAGTILADRLSSARLITADVRNNRVYDTRAGNVAARLGFAQNLSNSSRRVRPVLRAGYGLYFDQPFDNLWLNVRNNAFIFPSTGFEVPDQTNFTEPASVALQRLVPDSIAADFPPLTSFEPRMPAGAVHHYFLGLQTQLTPRLFVEINGIGSQGRHLVSTDTINRQFSVASGSEMAASGCDESRIQPCLPDIAHRGSEGWSSYRAFTASLTYRSARHLVAVTYTLGHSFDNQSDPLKGDFFDLTFASSAQKPGFTRQFDSRGDRGNSDFDQRQNLVIYSIWSFPTALRWRSLWDGWRFAPIAAFRSGFPFTVTDAISAPAAGGLLLARRADIVSSDRVWRDAPQPVNGGQLLLDSAAFCDPRFCAADRSKMGNTGRGAFRGPGFFNLDLSLSRVFAVPALSETVHFTVRADAFNLFNHANLGTPSAELQLPETFGVARYGRQLRDIGLPSLLPLRETGRQIQILLRVEF